MLMIMEYISNNNELNLAIQQMYHREIDPCELADIYFKYKLYSAAATYYIIELNSLHNCEDYEFFKKSYCFSKLAECYYNQQKDHKFSSWQLSLIHDMCKEAIVFDKTNIVAYLILGKCFVQKNELKNAYYIYNDLILNINNMNTFDDSYKDLLIDVILEYFTLCESFNIIKYDNIYKTILSFMLNNSCFDYNDISKINTRYQQHINYVDEFGLDVIRGNINKYY